MSDPTSKLEKAIHDLTAQYNVAARNIAYLISNEDQRKEYIEKLLENIRKDMVDSILFVHYRMKEYDDGVQAKLKSIDTARDEGQREARLYRRLTLGAIGLAILIFIIFGLYIISVVNNNG